jgi:hypothetical protein
MDGISRDVWDTMTPDEQWQYMELTERRERDLDDLLKLIPECPLHGTCIPHAKRWVRKYADIERIMQLSKSLDEEQS